MARRGHCERLGYFIGGDPQFPDLNRLFRDCVWNRERQRWEERLSRSEGQTVH